MIRIRPALPCEKKPCPLCERPISTSGRAWIAHQRMHQRHEHLPQESLFRQEDAA